MKKFEFMLFVLFIVLAACNLHEQVVDIRDVAKEEILILKKEKGQEHIHRLEIRIAAELEGDVKVSLILNGKAYERVDGA